MLNPALTSEEHLEQFKFLGILLGVAVRTKKPLDLHLAPMVWKQIAGEWRNWKLISHSVCPFNDFVTLWLRVFVFVMLARICKAQQFLILTCFVSSPLFCFSGQQVTEEDIEEVDALYMQNLRGIAELSGGEITIDNFSEVRRVQ